MRKIKITKRPHYYIRGIYIYPPPAIWDGSRMEWEKRLQADLCYKYNTAGHTAHYEGPSKVAPIHNRLEAEMAMLRCCPDYYVLFEPLTRTHATEEEIMQAKRNLIKARYPKFYKEVFEDNDSSPE